MVSFSTSELNLVFPLVQWSSLNWNLVTRWFVKFAAALSICAPYPCPLILAPEISWMQPICSQGSWKSAFALFNSAPKIASSQLAQHQVLIFFPQPRPFGVFMSFPVGNIQLQVTPSASYSIWNTKDTHIVNFIRFDQRHILSLLQRKGSTLNPQTLYGYRICVCVCVALIFFKYICIDFRDEGRVREK